MSIHGIWTAIVSPFQADGSLDLEAYQSLVNRQIQAKVQGIIPCGTTGESPTLRLEEKKKLIETTLSLCKNTSVKVFAGTGSNNTAETVEFSRWASNAGVDGLLVVTPYYNKPSQSGLLKHFLAVADAVSCPIMLYQVPGRTAVRFEVSTLVELAKHPRITALKEASSDVNLVKTLFSELKKNNLQMDILSGDDPTFLDYLKAGATGVVSVASNLIPQEMVELYDAFCAQNLEKAQKIQDHYADLFKNLFIESNPTPVKTALSTLNLCQSKVRLPLDQLTAKNLETLKATLRTYQIGERNE